MEQCGKIWINNMDKIWNSYGNTWKYNEINK
jgi:hypothetical protein